MIAQIKLTIYRLARHFGYEITPVIAKEFSLDNLRFACAPGSIGRLPESEGAAKDALAVIRERKLADLKILDMACGVGIIGLYLVAKLDPSIVRQIDFADINIFNLNSLRHNLKINRYDHEIDRRIHLRLSDGFQHIPPAAMYDLIIVNPPHFWPNSAVDLASVTSFQLGAFDPGGEFHRAFLEQAPSFLSSRGEIWLLANRTTGIEPLLQNILSANSALSLREKRLLPGQTKFFWLIITPKAL